MTKEVRTRTFKSGNSVAVRLPKTLGIEEGTEVRVREEQGRYVVEPVDAPKRKLDVDKFWGKAKGMVHVPSRQREFDPRPSELQSKH
jgi:antitoxin VapB